MPTAARLGQESVVEEALGERRGLPATGGEAAEQRGLGSRLVEMERQGVKLGGEGEDALAGHRGLSEGDGFADAQIFERSAGGGSGAWHVA